MPNIIPRIESLVVVIVAAIILCIRKTDAILNPQFWAEDGTVLFFDQYHEGISSIFKAYAGYLHTAPRAIALFADLFFSTSSAPYVYNYLSLIITLLVIVSLYSPRLIMGNKALLALTIVLVPHFTNEIFLTAVNIGWVLALLIVITLVKETPHEKYGNIYLQIFCDFSVIIICGLTGPFIIISIPFFILRLINEKNLYCLALFVSTLIPSSIQLYSMASHPFSQSSEFNYASIEPLAAVVGQKLLGGLFLGVSIPYQINAFFLCSLFCFLIILLAYLSAGDKKRIFKIVTFLGFSTILLLMTFYKFKLNLNVLIPPHNGPRYFYIPYVMIVWSLIVFIDLKTAWKRNLSIVLLVMALISSLTSGFRSYVFIDFDWSIYSELIGKEKHLEIPINPRGWVIKMGVN